MQNCILLDIVVVFSDIYTNHFRKHLLNVSYTHALPTNTHRFHHKLTCTSILCKEIIYLPVCIVFQTSALQAVLLYIPSLKILGVFPTHLFIKQYACATVTICYEHDKQKTKHKVKNENKCEIILIMDFSDLLSIINNSMMQFVVFINLDVTLSYLPYFECLVIEHYILFLTHYNIY